MKPSLLLAPVALLAGCVTITPVTDLGAGRYMVAVQMKGDPSKGWTDVKIMAIDQARQSCTAKGLDLEVVGTEELGVRGFSPMNVEVTFKCNAKTA